DRREGDDWCGGGRGAPRERVRDDGRPRDVGARRRGGRVPRGRRRRRLARIVRRAGDRARARVVQTGASGGGQVAFFLPGRSGVGFDFGDITSAISSVAAPVLAPVLKVAAPVLKPLEAAYKMIPTPVKALLAPQTLITEYAYQHPEQIPMF